MKISKLIMLSCVMLSIFGTAQAQNKSVKNPSDGSNEANSARSGKHSQKSSKAQAGGLPALAAEMDELRAIIESVQGQINGSDDPYNGIYTVSLVENAVFGCGFTNDPGALLGSPQFVEYLQEQGISSASTRIAYFDATADGYQLLVPDHMLSSQELRLSGTYESDVRLDPGSVVTIASNGALLLDTGGDSVFRGQMSADGSSFVAQAFGVFDEGGCDDSFVLSLVGVRK